MSAAVEAVPGLGLLTPVVRLRFVREGACELPPAITDPKTAAAMFLDRLADEAALGRGEQARLYGRLGHDRIDLARHD